MMEVIAILVGTTVLAALKPTAAQARRFQRRARPPARPAYSTRPAHALAIRGTGLATP